METNARLYSPNLWIRILVIIVRLSWALLIQKSRCVRRSMRSATEPSSATCMLPQLSSLLRLWPGSTRSANVSRWNWCRYSGSVDARRPARRSAKPPSSRISRATSVRMADSPSAGWATPLCWAIHSLCAFRQRWCFGAGGNALP